MILVSRQEWGARAPTNVTKLDLSQLRGVALHYTASNWDEAALHADCAGRVRGIQNYHMDTQKWADIAYNHLVCKHGYVFEGRGFGVRCAANGTADANTMYQAVCFLGDDTPDVDDVGIDGRIALIQIMALYLETYPHARVMRPHRFFVATSCPGDQLTRWLTQLDNLL